MLMMGTAESRSVSLRVQLSTAPTSLVPISTTATLGVVYGSSPLRRRQFRLLIWSSATPGAPCETLVTWCSEWLTWLAS